MSRTPVTPPSGGRPVPGERVFRLALRAHPLPFRRRYADDMVELYRDGWRREAAHRPIAAKARYCLVAWSGAVRAGFGQRRTPLTGGAGIRYAARTLLRRPMFTLVVMTTLALGIGANTAVFSVLHGALIAPLPWHDGERLVRIYVYAPEFPDDPGPLTALGFAHFREHAESLVGLAATYTYRSVGVDLTDGDRPERVPALPVTEDYFRVMGALPILGRGFTSAETAPDDPDSPLARVAVVSSRVWEAYLGGSARAVGETLTIDARPYTVVGVAPDGFEDPVVGPVDVFVPQDVRPGGSNHWDNFYLTAIGRLGHGVTLTRAQAEIGRLARNQWEIPGNDNDYLARVVALRDDRVGSAEPLLLTLMGAVGLVLLIACVNVSSLTLAEGARRERELSVRAALGSARWRIVLQLLAESLLLAGGGGIAGLVVGFALTRGLVALAPEGIPGVDGLGMDPALFAFTATATVASGVVFGLVPAFRFSRVSVEGVLRDGGRAGAGRGRSRLRRALVVAELALALVLLAGAGVLTRSFARLSAVDLNLAPDNVLTFEVNLPGTRYGEPAARATFHRDYLERLGSLPGVRAAGAISWLPANGEYHRWGVRRVFADDTASENTPANQRVVEADVFRALGIPVRSGRTFGPEDTADAPRRVIVNEALVERLLPDGDPIGQRIQTGPWPMEVIGVVADVPVTRRGLVVPTLYHSHTQFADNRNWSLVYTLATDGPRPGLVDTARATLADIDPHLVLHRPTPLAVVIGRGVAYERFAMVLLTTFAGIGLLLAAVGIYGVLAHTVQSRRHELGVRMALGAASRHLLRLVVRQGLQLAATGIALGLLGAFALTRLLGSLVFDVSVRDPLVYGAVTIGLLGVAAAASLIPARRATRVDPAEALRAD